MTPGVYEYKYIVDGVWKYSNHEQTTDDGHGNINNIVDTNSIERQKQILNKFGSNANNGNYAPNINLNNANTYTEINYQYDKNKNSGDLYEAHTVNDGKAKHLEKNNPQNKQESGLKINEGNFENTANNFNEEAPEIPSHLMCIPFLAVFLFYCFFMKFNIFLKCVGKGRKGLYFMETFNEKKLSD